MAGHTGDAPTRRGATAGLVYLPCTAANGFLPHAARSEPVDLIYLCFPNNPTGAVRHARSSRRG